MSSEALLGSNISPGPYRNLVEINAGKMTVKGKMVYPDTRKGMVYVFQSDDSLMHFCWKNRKTMLVEEDLIIFPDDCEFKHVPQCKTGRVYLLRFKSSNKKFFFWFQDLKTDKDEEQCRKVNEVLNNPPILRSQRSSSANADGDIQNLLNNMSQQQLMQLFGGVGPIGSLGGLLGSMIRPYGVQSTRAPTRTASTQATTNASRSTTQNSVPDSPKPHSDSKTTTSMDDQMELTPSTPSTPVTTTSNNKIQYSDLQDFLSEIPTPAGAEPVVQRGVATELTNAIPAAISTTESLERAMTTHLPAGDNLCTTLSSPQFSQALSMFWSALQSGQAGPVIRQFGLGSDAVNAAASGNIEEFVSALESEAKTGQGQTQQGQDDKSTKQPSPAASPNKKDDDDEGMALD